MIHALTKLLSNTFGFVAFHVEVPVFTIYYIWRIESSNSFHTVYITLYQIFLK